MIKKCVSETWVWISKVPSGVFEHKKSNYSTILIYINKILLGRRGFV